MTDQRDEQWPTGVSRPDSKQPLPIAAEIHGPEQPLVVHHRDLVDLMKAHYSLEDLQRLAAFLEQHRVFRFPSFDNGLFPAVPPDLPTARRSGYGNVWVRDNIHIAHAHAVCGHPEEARRCVRTLARFFVRSEPRFRQIIELPARSVDPMNRPHIRFDGARCVELNETWSHAQNDALGYFLWLFCRFLAHGTLEPEPGDGAIVARFALYFQAIRYWEDQDSGHWEEARKVSASSIGVVVAGLGELKKLLKKNLLDPTGDGQCRTGERVGPRTDLIVELVEKLLARGRSSLEQILPAECVEPHPDKYRRYDSALLFLVEPLNVVGPEMARTIVEQTLDNLQGDYGICRYRGDSYWAPDFDRYQRLDRPAAVDTETLEWRNRLGRVGQEAQWCIFDPVVSTYFGKRFQSSGHLQDQHRQTWHFNRALGQITGEHCAHGPLRCPEAYYVSNGHYVANDQTPLLWTQANLWIALQAMQASAARSPGAPG